MQNIFQEESNGQLKMTKSSKIVLDFFFSVNMGDKSYIHVLTIQTVLGGGGVTKRIWKHMVLCMHLFR